MIAGLFSRFVIAPLDVVKIRLQLQSNISTPIQLVGQQNASGGPTYRGILQTMRRIVAEETIRGLWKGNIPAELLYMTYGAAQFLAYQQSSVLVSSIHPTIGDNTKSFVSGAMAGGAATLATYPLDLLRTRFAAQGSEKVALNLSSSIDYI